MNSERLRALLMAFMVILGAFIEWLVDRKPGNGE
jgi:hypothetical protein